ncbi:MAG: hypothetical protein H6712_08440 [Myxococcales bacterium]|nr:hypothetical protein [Myxococcales bacterium]
MLTFPCGQCGADLQFKAGTNAMTCPYCGHVESIAADQRPIVEYDLKSGLAAMRRAPARALATEGKAIQCGGCGAVAVVTTAASRCAFCDAPSVVEIDSAEEVFLPESLLPFGLDERAARELFAKWVAGRWFAPSDLVKRARTEKIDGVYLPYWTYDSQTTTRYTGLRGKHYWDTESYTDSNGKRQTRRVRKTRWYPAAGVVQVPFDDVLICASGSLPPTLTEALEPWDLQELRSYAPQFLSGFIAERYGVSLEQGFARAEERMEPLIRSAIRADIGGDTQQILSVRISHAHTTFKHLLLPAWISSYRYHDKVFRALVNARTGEVVGERPWSWVKITLTVLAVVAVIVTVVLLSRYG